jgi:CDP-diacylglycerol--glycerol-3-phosphate 3-phosphatidyltransferase
MARLGPDPALFPVHASSIEVLTPGGPTAFHQLLRALLAGAKRRISLASLYLGTGTLEAELLDDIRGALARSPGLTVRMVMDGCRGRRTTDNGTSATFVASLVGEHPGRVEAFLHRMPQPASRVFPSPLDECIGVCHFKALVVDDLAILTGANLSDEYFHCRQARYIVVRDPLFADMLDGVVETASRHSQRIRPARGGRARLERPACSPREVGDAVLERVLQARRAGGEHDTCLLPVFQHPALGLQQERELLRRMLAWNDGDLVINTPYTNFPPDYVDALGARLASAASRAHRTLIVLASPSSHSFTTGRGLKALVPGIYLHREQCFRERLAARAPSPRLELYHYHREGWVFHSKGIWFTSGDETASIIGSSSFGARSVARDFDMSCLIVTSEPRLRAALAGEVDTMLAFSRPATAATHRPQIASRMLSPLVKGYM